MNPRSCFFFVQTSQNHQCNDDVGTKKTKIWVVCIINIRPVHLIWEFALHPVVVIFFKKCQKSVGWSSCCKLRFGEDGGQKNLKKRLKKRRTSLMDVPSTENHDTPRPEFLRRGIVSYFFVLGRVLRQRKYKSKHCRNVLGRVLGQKRNKIQIRSFKLEYLSIIRGHWDEFDLNYLRNEFVSYFSVTVIFIVTVIVL